MPVRILCPNCGCVAWTRQFPPGASFLPSVPINGAWPDRFLAVYEELKQHEETITAQGKIRLVEANERLVQLYEVTGKKDKATEWRAKLPVTNSAKPAEAAALRGPNELPADVFARP